MKKIFYMVLFLVCLSGIAHGDQQTILNSQLNGGSYDWDAARGDINSNFDENYEKLDWITVTGPVNLDEMDAFIDANTIQISELVTLSGMPAHSTDLGSFTGSTIPDNSDNKEAFQALEDAVEAAGASVWGSITGTLSNQTDLQNELDGKVGLSGAETINDVKTFSSYPIGPAIDPTLDDQLATKRYVDESSSDVVYPDAGIPLSTGAAWGTSYTTTTLQADLDGENQTPTAIVDQRNASSVLMGPSQYTLSADLPDTDIYKEFLMSGITGLNDGNAFSLWDGTDNLYQFWTYGLPVNDGDHIAYNALNDRMEFIADTVKIEWQTSDPEYSDESGIYVNTSDGDAFLVDQNVGISTWTTTYTVIPAAEEYYVANAANGGSDANDGLTTGTPWETIAKVVATELLRGDIVYFNRGDIFDDARLHLDDNGAVGEPITYTAYGTGDLPIVRQIYQRDTFGGSISNVTVDNIHQQGVPASSFGDNGIDMQGTVTNLTIQNCEISNNDNHGFYLGANVGQDYIDLVIDNNNIHDNKLVGLFIQAGDTTSSNATISNNVLVDNVSDCNEAVSGNYDSFTAGGGSAIVENNYIVGVGVEGDCNGSGMDLVYRAATVRYNTVVGTSTNSAFAAKTYIGDECEVYGNIFTGGIQSGMELTNRDDTGGTFNIYNNVIAYNEGAGIMRQIVAPMDISNNIFYNNGTNLSRWNYSHIFTNFVVGLDGDPRSDITSDHNMFYSSNGIPIGRDRNAPTPNDLNDEFTLAQWQAIPHDVNSTEQDPLFVDPGNRDFRLQAGSPALTIGTTLASPYDEGIGYDSTIGAAGVTINLITRLPDFDMGAFQDVP